MWGKFFSLFLLFICVLVAVVYVGITTHGNIPAFLVASILGGAVLAIYEHDTFGGK